MERSLKDLISQLPIPGLKESHERRIIAESISNLLSLPIKPDQIHFKDGVITLSTQPVVKSALQVRQAELLSLLEKEGISVKQLR